MLNPLLILGSLSLTGLGPTNQSPGQSSFLREKSDRPAVLLADAEAQPQAPEVDMDKVYVEDLRGVILYGNPDDVQLEKIPSVHGLVVKGLDVPGGVEKLTAVLEPIFLDKPLTLKLLETIKQTIVQYYIDQKQPLMVVDVPEQNITSGVLQLIVRRGHLGEVEVKGNKYFTAEQLLRYIELQKGNAIDYDVLLSDVDWMNRSPFRNTQLLLSPGIFPGTTNVELLTTDRRPVDVYVGADNTGIKQTGFERIYGGINATNFFGLDHIFNYQYTLSPRWPRYQAHVINYTIPLPWKHIFISTLGYEKSFPSIPEFHCLTRSLIGNLRYIIPIHPTYSKLQQEIVCGADFNDNVYRVEFLPASLRTNNRVVMTQVMAGYNFSYQFPTDSMVFSAQIFYSPGSWLPDQSNAHYRRSRPYSNHTFVFGNFFFQNTYTFKNKFQIMTRVKGQLANVNLLFGQYTLGDYYSVRGYQDQFGIDNAFVFNLELLAPNITFLKNKSGNLVFLVFYDYALGGDHKPLPVIEPPSVYLMSVGPAMRFQISPYLWTRLDWGFPLHRLPPIFVTTDQGRKPWLQFGLLVKY